MTYKSKIRFAISKSQIFCYVFWIFYDNSIDVNVNSEFKQMYEIKIHLIQILSRSYWQFTKWYPFTSLLRWGSVEVVPLDLSGAWFDVGGSSSSSRLSVVSGLGFHLSHSYSTGLSTEVASRFTLNRKRGGIGRSVCLCVYVCGGVIKIGVPLLDVVPLPWIPGRNVRDGFTSVSVGEGQIVRDGLGQNGRDTEGIMLGQVDWNFWGGLESQGWGGFKRWEWGDLP